MSSSPPWSPEFQPAEQPPQGDVPSFRRMALLHGAVSIVLGLLLIFVPERTLTFVALLAGFSLIAVGAIELVGAFRPNRTGVYRVASVLVGVVATITGVVVIIHPQSSVKLIAILLGLFLLLHGVLTLVFGIRGQARSRAWLPGALELAAGIALLAWPKVTVGAIALIYGLALVAMGLLELFFARKASDP